MCECVCLERDDAHIWNVATVLPYLERYDAHFSDRYLERIDAPICQDTMSIFGMMRLHCHIWRCDTHIWKYTMPIFVKIQCHIGTGATVLPYLDRHDAHIWKDGSAYHSLLLPLMSFAAAARCVAQAAQAVGDGRDGKEIPKIAARLRADHRQIAARLQPDLSRSQLRAAGSTWAGSLATGSPGQFDHR